MSSELSKLEEMFYLEVGASYSLSLAGFIRKVAEHYEESIKTGMKVFSFDSFGVEDSLSLIVGSRKTPYIAGITIRQASTSLDRVLENVNGDLEVNYSGLAASGKHRYPGKVAVHTTDGKLYKITIKKDPKFINLLLRLSSVGNELKELIGRGESFVVTDSSYEHDDPRELLVHLHCSIRHDGARYFFEYVLSTANLDPIPTTYLKLAEGIFSIAAPFFQKASVYRARTSSFGRDHDAG